VAEGDQQKSEELTVVLNDLGLRIDRLKTLYEQYFMGIERMEPMVARKEVTRTMLTLQQGYIRNTGLRFKFNMMLQKWSSYTTYWNRTLREIENGTYVRHLQKAARAAAEKGRALPAEMQTKATEATPGFEAPGPSKLVPPPARTATKTPVPPPPVPQSAKTPIPQALPIPGSRPGPPPLPSTRTPIAGTPVATPVPGMSESELRALHKKYVDARSAAGDSAPVRYESLVASLAKQVPKVLEQPGVRGVKFDVSVQGGKAVLKAIPTK
jgi:hypothetical protein